MPVNPSGAAALALSRFRVLLSKSTALQAYFAPESATAEADTLAKIFVQVAPAGTDFPFCVVGFPEGGILRLDRAATNGFRATTGRVTADIRIAYDLQEATADERQAMLNLPGDLGDDIMTLGDANGFAVRAFEVLDFVNDVATMDADEEGILPMFQGLFVAVDWGVTAQ